METLKAVRRSQKLIVLRLIGGLGNQLFEYAYARMLQEKYHEPLYLDISYYEYNKVRNYSLNYFHLAENVAVLPQNLLNKALRFNLMIRRKAYGVRHRLNKDIIKKDALGEKAFKTLSKRGYYFNFDEFYYPFCHSNKPDKYIYGYFQSEKYFGLVKDKLIQEFNVTSSPSIENQKTISRMNSTNSVGVSIRRGDYIGSSIYDICQEEYYYNAMSFIASKIENPNFYIFSDDISDVKRNFKFHYPVHYIENQPDYESLRLLKSCKHFVIANSSFSWWGSYLANKKNKITVAPSQWYNNSTRKPDIYLDGWITLDV
jgi:hypothetical protein